MVGKYATAGLLVGEAFGEDLFSAAISEIGDAVVAVGVIKEVLGFREIMCRL